MNTRAHGWTPILASLGLSIGTAQIYGPGSKATLSDACNRLNNAALNQVANGRLEDAEQALSQAVAVGENGAEQACSRMLLHNMAAVMARSGRFAEAEVLVERSVKMLDKIYPPDDPILLRPLQLLSSVRFEERKLAKAREAFGRMRLIHIERPEDRALFHSTAAVLLQAESRHAEAEAEYVTALAAWQESGRGATADAAGVLTMLGDLYVADRRFVEAGEKLDRALAILNAAHDTVPTDRIKLLNSRAVLHVRQGDWRDAAEDLRSAITMADAEAHLDPAELASVLVNYAYVLRKIHRRREARSIEARAASLDPHRTTDGVVDVSELLAKTKTRAR